MDSSMTTWRTVPVPVGPHRYTQRTRIGNVKEGITAEGVFEVLRRHATPLQKDRIESAEEAVRGDNPFGRPNDRTDIPILGPVRHEVFPEHRTIVNSTLGDHLLHPGNVFRTVVQEGDDIFIVTDGYGEGILPFLNAATAPRLWGFVDEGIRERLGLRSPSTFEGLMPSQLVYGLTGAEGGSENVGIADVKIGPSGNETFLSGPRQGGALGGINMMPPRPPPIGWFD
jgi:hypothetical protein